MRWLVPHLRRQQMSIPTAWPQVLDFFGTPLVIEPSPGQLSSDAGLLPIRQFDERIGLTRAFADTLNDPRDPDLTEHTFQEMVRSRVYGILAGYEDQNDHDTLRHDPVFKLLADRSPEDDELERFAQGLHPEPRPFAQITHGLRRRRNASGRPQRTPPRRGQIATLCRENVGM
jgi:hypothetical protein